MLNNSANRWPVVTDAIESAILQSLKEGSWGQYDSHWADLLIHRLISEFQTESAMLCSSGTIAVELALRGCAVRPDDEVILAGYDFPGNFRAIEAIGARPVLIDVVKDGWVADADQIESAFSESTAAVIVSHLHGQVADLAKIQSVIDVHNEKSNKQVSLVEDACQVPGGKLNGKSLGGFGDVSTLSFGGSKLLSAGRGGAILSNYPDILQRARIFAQRGNDAFPLSQLQAAALCPQIEMLKRMTRDRNHNAQRLIEKIGRLDVLIGLKQIVPDVAPAFYKLPWLLKDRTPGWSRLEFVAALQAEGVPVGEGFRGFLRRSPRRCRKVGTLFNCQIAAQQTIVMHHPILLEPDETIQNVADAFEKVVSNPR